jgi:putative mRNA 3-end processing factor
MGQDLVVLRPQGLYCPAGDFYIDPWRKVDRAVITHAHADHARTGHGHYLSTTAGAGLLRARLGARIAVQALDYGEPLLHHGVRLSLHPAGHVLGAAQVRLEHQGRVWVASGDYYVRGQALGDRQDNPSCEPFEPVRCDCFITESTFGLPIYRWQRAAEVFADINQWWQANASLGRPSVLAAYSLGKAQQLLAGVDASIGPIVVHGAVDAINRVYRAAGIQLPATRQIDEVADPRDLSRALVIAPPSAQTLQWAAQSAPPSTAFASGWMQLRSRRRSGSFERGFALSNHADWPGLQTAIRASGCERVIVTHGFEATMVRWLREQGLDAGSFKTPFGQDDAGESGEPRPDGVTIAPNSGDDPRRPAPEPAA